MPAQTLHKINAHLNQHLETYLNQLARLCAQPSISAQNKGMEACAGLVADMLADHGFQAEILPSAGYPVVYAEKQAQSDKTLLFYLHYDVQPPEPLELWHSPPFEMTRRDDKLYARGIVDDKGHIIARLAAVAAVTEALGQLPCNIKFIIEGEEEIGSPNLPPFISQHRQKLAADACVWEFGGVNHNGVPLQYLGLRGICYVELSVQTANQDTHSGLGGSIFPNSAWRLVWALNSLKDANERILIPNHYQNVLPPSPQDLRLLAQLPDDTHHNLEMYGLRGFLNNMTDPLALKRAEVFEPTCTIAGLSAGYQQAGVKTIIPATASAKVDFRLVPNQTPPEVLHNLRLHLDARGFNDVEITFLGGGPAGRTDPAHPFVQLANEAAETVYGREPLIVPITGGSGPIYPFVHELALPVVTAGIGYPGGQFHAPNEHLRLDDFIKGIQHTAHIIYEFAQSAN